MRPTDIDSFYASRADLDAEAYVELDFSFECTGDPREAAAHLASEQSTAQWKRVDVDEDFRPRFGAKVVSITSERRSTFSAPIPVDVPGEVHACHVTIAHPHANFGPRFPNLISAVMGEGAFFAPRIPLVRLEDIRFPASYLAEFEGPQFGIAGFRKLLQVFSRPIFFGVIKPNIGLAPEPFAQLGLQAWLGGLDVAKDDEMLADVDWSPLAERAARLGAARRQAERETGVPKVYLANITDEVDRLAELHDVAVDAGANAVMVNALPVGLSGLRLLRRHARVPIVTHFPFVAAFSRLTHYGVHAQVFTKLQRMAGADVIIMPGFGARMMTPEHEVLACIRACLEPLGSLLPSLPVPGGSDWAGTLEGVYSRLGTVDFGFIPGRGIFGHPQGPRGGAESVRTAWDAIAAGETTVQRAMTNDALRLAIEAFGDGSR